MKQELEELKMQKAQIELSTYHKTNKIDEIREELALVKLEID